MLLDQSRQTPAHLNSQTLMKLLLLPSRPLDLGPTQPEPIGMWAPLPSTAFKAPGQELGCQDTSLPCHWLSLCPLLTQVLAGLADSPVQRRWSPTCPQGPVQTSQSDRLPVAPAPPLLSRRPSWPTSGSALICPQSDSTRRRGPA